MTAGWTPPSAGRVARLRGASTEAVEAAPGPLPASALAFLTLPSAPACTAAPLVACALDELERAVLRLFPAWLPATGSSTIAAGTSCGGSTASPCCASPTTRSSPSPGEVPTHLEQYLRPRRIDAHKE